MQATDQAELDNWLDTARIIRVFDSYFRTLDEKHFDEPHFRQIFMPDAKVVRPTVGLRSARQRSRTVTPRASPVSRGHSTSLLAMML